MNEIQKRRDLFDALGQNYTRNSSVEVEPVLLNGVSCYWFIPENEMAKKIIIHLHGGVFVVGSIKSHESMISHFSAQLQTRILFVEYALAPEHPYPHGLNDVLDVYERLLSDYPDYEIVFMGDSAGAALIVSAIGKMQDRHIPLPRGVVMISPWIYLSGENPSLEENREIDPILSREYLLANARLYTGDTALETSSPGYINLNQFPPVLIMVGTNEVLLDDSKKFYLSIKDKQTNSKLSIYENQLHVWPLADVHSEASQKALKEIETFLTTLSYYTSPSDLGIENQELQTLMKNEKTYVFIPGGWHGAWAYDAITEKLERLGKNCISLTLPGLETQSGIPNRIINLDTHIQFVVDVFLKENLTDIILCGHSYAGLVITGVADKIPERIHALVYIDAYIPKDGDSCWSLTSDVYRQRFVAGAGNDGFTVADRPGVDNRRRPHPLATFMQRLRLNGDYERVPNHSFIYLSDWDDSPFVKQYENLKNSPDWHVETIHCGHNVMKERPDTLVDILYRLEDKYNHLKNGCLQQGIAKIETGIII